MIEVPGTSRYPYSAVCYIVCVFPNGSRASGSGAVVGANDVLTAMHVVYNASWGGYATSVTIYPGADTEPVFVTPFGSYADWGRINARTNNWDQDGNGLLSAREAQYDLAVIGLRSRIGDATGTLGLSSRGTDVTATMLGYPGRGTGLMAERVFADASSDAGVFEIDSSLGSGGSGGPLLTDTNHVLGVSSSGNASNTLGTYAGLFGPGNWDWLVTAMRDNDTLIGAGASPAPAPTPAPPPPANAVRTGGSGDDHFGFTRFDAPGPVTISDSGGIDIVNAYLLAGHHRIDLNAGSVSTIGANTVTIAPGTVIEDAMAYDGNDILVGNGADNTFYAEGGNDQMTGGGGNDYLDGGAGIDTAVFLGAHGSHRIDVAAGTVTDLVANRGGTDVVLDVERLKFTDVYVALDIDGNAGQAFRLYQAAFNRRPDLGGLGYQMHQLDIGARLVDVAQGFIASREFSDTYGALTTTGFVSQLYQNVLHRAPDASGLAFHTAAIASGTSRAQILVNFSESPENQAAVIGSIQNGIVYTFG